MKELKDWFVPWLLPSREYNVGILDKAWANQDKGRLMLNENPIPPSDKVINAVSEAMKHGNWYPDSFFFDCGPRSAKCTTWVLTMWRSATGHRRPSMP